jgi:hypothetical protein
MKNQCEQMYAELLTAIRTGKEQSHSHRKWIEDCFQLCFRAYTHLQKMAKNYQFADQQEEIWFHKAIGPLFAAQTKYFTLIYTAEVFIPDDVEKRMDYWRYELKKNLDFFDLHETFYQYYKKGLTNQDYHYFTSASSYADLLASFIAREKYLGFLLKKIGVQPQPGLRPDHKSTQMGG